MDNQHVPNSYISLLYFIIAAELMKLRAFWGLLVLLVSLVFPSFVNAQSSAVHIYGFAESPSMESLLGYFSESDCEVVLHNLNESSSEVFGRKVVETLWSLGIDVTPPTMERSGCIPCELPLFAYARGLTMRYASPLIGVFRDGRLQAITLGITEFEVLDKALNLALDDEVRVFAFENEYSLSDRSIRIGLQRLFLQQAEGGMEAPNIVSSIALLALADSVNPCIFAVFTALLLIVLHTLGKTKAALSGFSFITAIFLCYYVLGLGLIHILESVEYADKAVALVGFAVGAFSVMRGLNPKFKSPVPEPLRKFLDLQISRSYVSPAACFTLGIAASFALLPCSCGPYIVGLGLLSALTDSAQAHLLLVLYNALFVTPLIVVLLAVLSSHIYARKIKAWRGTRLGVMELVSGLILLLLCAYILMAPLVS